jgi:uncharacterized protein (TIGR02001 family)
MAQVTAEAGLQNDYRYRGYSLTDGNPVATVTLGYDDPSGVYAGGNLVGTFDDGEPELVAAQGTLGYAARVSPELSIDAGVSRTEYGAYVFGDAVHYTEVYLGLATRNVATRVRYSPDYYRSDWETLYVEIDGGLEVAPDWFVDAHAGQLTYLGEIGPYLVRHTYDWRLGGSRTLGPYAIHLEVSGRIAERPPALVAAGADNRLRTAGTAVVFGVTRVF